MGDLEGLKRVLRSLVVSTPTAVDAATLLRDYRRMVGGPLPVASYGYRDPILFLREQCADSFLFQGPQSNPVLTLIVNKAIKHIDQYVQSQKISKQTKPKRRSVPESIIRQPNLIANTFISSSKPRPSTNSFTNNSKSTPRLAEPQPRRPEPAPAAPVTRAESPTGPEAVRAGEVEHPSPRGQGEGEQPTPRGQGEGGAGRGGPHTRQRLQQYLAAYRSQQLTGSLDSLKLTDDDSGRQTSSSASGKSAAALAQLQQDIAGLVARRPAPVPCSRLLRLYEEEYGRELNFSRFGFASVSACACAVEALSATRTRHGDWLLAARHAPPAPPGAPAPPPRREPRPPPTLAPHDPDDDALPGVDYDPDVFPEDCLSFLESIPAGSVRDVRPGDMLEVVVGEVYSPSHLWLLRLGPDYDTMEDYMDQMTQYYGSGAGKDRVLAAGARRPGQYCSSVFEGDWHRSLIVQVLDADTVKVLHVDYGTVDTVRAVALRPLRREWAALPAQAQRALLAGLRPPASCRRWPRAAAAHCLALLRDTRLVANVVQLDREENILEVFLIDTSTDEDVNVTEEMIRAGHADPRPLPALGTGESYLFPLFRALEAGDTPNFAEIHALLRDGIALDFVDAYRRHVPALLPSDDTDDGSSGRGPSPPAELPRGPSPAPALPRGPSPPPALPRGPSPPPALPRGPSPAPAPTRVPFAMMLPARDAAPARPASPPRPASPAARPASPPPPPPATAAPPPPAPPAPCAPAGGGCCPAAGCCGPAARAHPAAVYALACCACARAGGGAPAPLYPYPVLRPEPPYVFRPEPPRPPPPYARPLPPYAPPLPPYGPAPAPAPRDASVRLSATECEVFERLSHVDPGAAHRYMMQAVRRARAAGAPGAAAGPPGLNPEAAEFRVPMRPPPGFENVPR